jgi:heterotetrameric sarcosine oxidase gamma subunit
MTRREGNCVPELIAKSPLAGRAPVTRGTLRLSETSMEAITSIALFPGQSKAIAKVLKPLGLTFPTPNTVAQSGEARLIWTGRDQAFLTGVPAPAIPPEVAAVTDQSDGWAGLAVEGPAAHEALMRWVPIDLRPAQFPVGMAIRAPLYHMQAIILRLVANRIDLMVFRSMARTAWHEIDLAMTTIEARDMRTK